MSTALIITGCLLLAVSLPVLAVELFTRYWPRPRHREVRTPEPPSPSATARRTLRLPLVPWRRRERGYDGAGDGVEYGALLHALVVERDLDPRAPIDPDDQRWAAEIAEFKAHLDEAVATCARGIYRAALRFDGGEALTTTGQIPVIRAEVLV